MPHAPVLLVDPNPDGLELYATALALEGIPTATARSAEEALTQLDGLETRVLVTGARLPGTPASDLIRTARRSTSSDLFIVALSTSEDLGRRAREAGCDVVLDVPCMPETLVGELRRALS